MTLQLILMCLSSADELPPGSWRGSARNYHMIGHKLVADLKDEGGNWDHASVVVQPGVMYENHNGAFGADLGHHDQLIKQLNDDIARQKALPDIIKAQQQKVDVLTSEIDNAQKSSIFTDNERSIIVRRYRAELKKATDDQKNQIQKIQNNQALSADQKSLLITNVHEQDGPKIEKLQNQYDDAKQNPTMSDQEKSIVLEVYHQQMATEKPKLEALQKESNELPAKIKLDRQRIAALTKSYEPTSYDGHDWEGRKQARWDRMYSGDYGHYTSKYLTYNSVFFGPPLDMLFFDDWDFKWVPYQVASFSTDGKTTVDGDACSPEFDVRADTWTQRHELAKLLADAKFDREHSSTFWLDRFYWNDLNNQIRYLGQRIANEKN